jgi:iron complex outermembrane receptor protein
MKATLLMLLTCLCIQLTWGQDSIPFQEGKVLEIKGHWFTFQAQDFFSTIKIDPDMLSQQRAGQLSNTITFLPGVSALSTGVGIAKPVIRGFSGARVAVLDMGIRQEGQQWGNDHGLEWDQYSIGSINIIKGAASIEYGGDALGGVLVIEHEPWTAAKHQSQILSVVSNNNRQRGWSLGHQQKFSMKKRGKSRIGFRITQLATDDYRVPVESFTYLNRTLPLKDGVLNNTATREQHLTAFAEWQFLRTALRSLKLTYRLNDTHSGLFPGFIGIPTMQSVLGDGDERNISLPQSLSVHQKFLVACQFKDGDEMIRFNVGFQKSSRAELSRPHQPGYVPVNADSLSLKLSLYTTQWNIAKDWTLTAGRKLKTGMQFQLKQNEVGGNEFLIPAFVQSQQSAFATLLDNPSTRFQQFVGVRVEQGRLVAKGYEQPWYQVNEPTDSFLTRSVPFVRHGLGWAAQYGLTWNGSKEWSLHAVLGKVYRIPQINEMAINGIHHGSHRHEKGYSDLQWESGYQWDMNLMKEWKRGHAQITGFVAYYDRYIYLAPQAFFSDLPDGGQVYEYVQRPVFWSGGECFLDWHPLHWWNSDFAIEGLYTQEMRSGLGLPFIPPVTLKTNQRWFWRWNERQSFSFLIHLRWAMDQNRVSRNEKTTPGYFVLNANVEYQYQFSAERHISWILQCNNALNTVYFNHLSLYRPMNLAEQGRWIQTTIALNF